MIIKFLKNTRISSRILFVLWILSSLSFPQLLEMEGEIVPTEIYPTFFLAFAIFFMIPAVWIEHKHNAMISNISFARLALGLYLILYGVVMSCTMIAMDITNSDGTGLNVIEEFVAKFLMVMFCMLWSYGGFRILTKSNRNKKIADKSKADFNELQKKEELDKLQQQNKESVKKLIKDESYKNLSVDENAKQTDLGKLQQQNKESVKKLIRDNNYKNVSVYENAKQTDLGKLQQQNKESVKKLIKDNNHLKGVGMTKQVYANIQEKSMRLKQDEIEQNMNSKFEPSTVINQIEVTKPSIKDLLIQEIDFMDGHVFEEFCAELLRQNGYVNVYVTPGSNDQGADIIAEKNEIKYAVQCKRVNNRLNNKPLQEVALGRAYYNCDIAVVLTNNYFNENAKNASKLSGIQLWDRQRLLKLIDEVQSFDTLKEYI